MTRIGTRRAIATSLVIVLALGAWYLGRPHVPDGQPPLVTLDAASLSSLRGAFNRDADHVRIIVLPSPT